MVRFRWLWVLLIGAATLLAGCTPGADRQVPETQNKSYLRAKRYLREDRKDEALEAFLLVITETPANSPESHLEVGRLYQNSLNDPIAAIYHYRKFLAQRPEGQEAPIVRQMIESAKKDFAAQLPGSPFDSDADRLDLLKMLQEARTQNEVLREELAAASARANARQSVAAASSNHGNQTMAANTSTGSTHYPQGVTTNINPQQGSRQSSPAPAATTAATRPAQQGPQTGQQAAGQARRYVVEAGDTLTRISNRMYGTPSHWEEIFHANRDILSTPHSLRVGQSLVIP